MRILVAATVVLWACGPGAPAPGRDVAVGTSGAVRATRRAYDGAPPTVPHPDPGASCSACHDADGQAVGGRVAPASPHVGTAQVGGTERCRQCHAFVMTDALFVPTRFIGLPQNLRPGSRATPGAPPTIPHRVLMRENCAACHAGQGIREEIRTSHPERQRCRQCHVPTTVPETFASRLGGATEGGERP